MKSENSNFCDRCGKEFRYPNELEKHNKKLNCYLPYYTKHIFYDRTCKRCYKIFDSKYKLERHNLRKKKCEKNKKKICNLCGNTFTTKTNLNVHSIKCGDKFRKQCMKEHSDLIERVYHNREEEKEKKRLKEEKEKEYRKKVKEAKKIDYKIEHGLLPISPSIIFHLVKSGKYMVPRVFTEEELGLE